MDILDWLVPALASVIGTLVGGGVSIVTTRFTLSRQAELAREAQREQTAQLEQARLDERWRESRVAGIELGQIFGDIEHTLSQALLYDEQGEHELDDPLPLANGIWVDETRRRVRHLVDQIAKAPHREALSDAIRQEQLYRRISPHFPEGYRIDRNIEMIGYAADVASSYARGDDELPERPGVFKMVEAMNAELAERLMKAIAPVLAKVQADSKRLSEQMIQNLAQVRWPTVPEKGAQGSEPSR